MSKANKIVLAIAALVIVGLLIFAGVSGGYLGTVACPECDATGVVHDVACDSCGEEGVVATANCETIDCPACEYSEKEETFIRADAPCDVCDGEGKVQGTIWALFPPMIAIGLALITKEVYSSLFVGVFVGGLIHSKFSFLATVDSVINDGLIPAVADTAGIFIFLVELGILVALVNKSGASAAFGKWAATHIKTKVGALLSTFLLGVLIFIDDYFNCLTVGSVMRPVTDAHKISRSKLAFIIDATAAPVCMIAPISSWAAAVSGYAPEGEGLNLFINAIPYNFYSLLTLVFIVVIVLMGFDYGKMAMHEYNANVKGDLFSGEAQITTQEEEPNPKGRVFDLIFPVIVLIGVCVFSLVYVGGALSGSSFVQAFADTDATVGLPWGGLIALVITIAYLIARKVISFKEAMEAVPKGFIAMVPAILILTFATALKNMTGNLGAKYFVADLMDSAAAGLLNFLPAIIFVVACVLAFATGTSWGTFGILIPIVVSMFPADSELMIISMSACLAGAVCGDHCSPISDTTIMSSAGAQCDHLNHVSTQIPYALTIAALSFVCYIIAGFIQSWYIVLPIGIVLTVATLFVLKAVTKNKKYE